MSDFGNRGCLKTHNSNSLDSQHPNQNSYPATTHVTLTVPNAWPDETSAALNEAIPEVTRIGSPLYRHL